MYKSRGSGSIPEVRNLEINISPDSIKILILWTVTPSLVEAFHAAFYSLFPHQSYWVASLVRSRTRLIGLVRRLASLAHRSTGNAQSKWVASLACRLTGLVRCLASLAHRSTGNAQSVREVPRLLTTPGQTLIPPYRTNFVRKDSGC